MKKQLTTIAFAFIGFLCFGINGKCENIVAYEDEFVSFEYDTDCYSTLNKMIYDRFISYSYSTEMKESDHSDFVLIRIMNIEEYEKNNELEPGTWKEDIFSEGSSDDYNKKIIKDGDFPEIEQENYENNSLSYSKLIGYNSEYFATITHYTYNIDSDLSKACKLIYDTSGVTDYFKNSENFSVGDDDAIDIYSNVIFSDQMTTYAKQAIEIMENYLAFKIDSKDASDQLEEINKRIKSYKETSEYKYDYQVYQALMVTPFRITAGDDGEIAETLKELKELIHAE